MNVFSFRTLCKSYMPKPLLFVLFAFASLFTHSALAQSGYNILSSTSVQFYANNASWADAHYIINGGPQQNVRMTNSGTNNSLTVAVPANATVKFFLTIFNGSATDTAWVTFTATPGGGGGGGNTTGTVTVFRDCNYTGASVGLAVGRYTLSQLIALGVKNDDVSSLRVTSGYKATLYKDDNFTGGTVVKSGDDSCLVDDSFNDLASSIVVEANGTTTDPGTPGTANGAHKRLKIVNGCGNPMWVQWLTAPGINFNATNFKKLDSLGSFTEFDIPDKGLPSMRFWPGFGCDANGKNCRVGSSGGPAALGFTCPPTGCAPPIDSKFEASFGCIPGVTDAQCVQNPSAPGQPLGRGDWWNSSFVDGYTTPMKVVVHGNCPTGPQPAPVFGPGGPPGGVIDCSTIRVSDCPTNENLSTNGQFPQFNSVNLIATNPSTGAVGGCYSPAAKLTFNHWANGFPTYPADSAQAKMYACPTPPISPDQCSAGPAAKTKFHDMVHRHCATYTYPYDDGVGLSSCPAATNLSYEVTFYCPQ